MPSNFSPVLDDALKLPIFDYLKDKRVVLASASPRRKEILETSVCTLLFFSPSLCCTCHDMLKKIVSMHCGL